MRRFAYLVSGLFFTFTSLSAGFTTAHFFKKQEDGIEKGVMILLFESEGVVGKGKYPEIKALEKKVLGKYKGSLHTLLMLSDDGAKKEANEWLVLKKQDDGKGIEVENFLQTLKDLLQKSSQKNRADVCKDCKVFLRAIRNGFRKLQHSQWCKTGPDKTKNRLFLLIPENLYGDYIDKVFKKLGYESLAKNGRQKKRQQLRKMKILLSVGVRDKAFKLDAEKEYFDGQDDEEEEKD